MIVYILIIILMSGGAGFYIYKNYKLSQSLEAPEDYISPAEKIKIAYKNINQSQESEQAAQEDNKDKINNINPGEIDTRLDLSIFSDPKFRGLIDNSGSVSRYFKAGKINIFEP